MFSDKLYETLARGQPVDAAVNDGRRALSVQFADERDWSTPVLYLRSPNLRIVDPEKLGGTLAVWVKPLAAWIRPAFVYVKSQPRKATTIAAGAVIGLSATVMALALWPVARPSDDLFKRSFLPEDDARQASEAPRPEDVTRKRPYAW